MATTRQLREDPGFFVILESRPRRPALAVLLGATWTQKVSVDFFTYYNESVQEAST